MHCKNLIFVYIISLTFSNIERVKANRRDVVVNQHGHKKVTINQFPNGSWTHGNGFNWKECGWNYVNDDKDTGVIKSCSFNKLSSDSYLRVVVATNMRIYNCDACCARWFVTFDGKECSALPIDGVVYMVKGKSPQTQDLHRPRVITGSCLVSKTGTVNVALNVGRCKGYSQVINAYTGWNSATRIMIEEIGQPQS